MRANLPRKAKAYALEVQSASLSRSAMPGEFAAHLNPAKPAYPDGPITPDGLRMQAPENGYVDEAPLKIAEISAAK